MVEMVLVFAREGIPKSMHHYAATMYAQGMPMEMKSVIEQSSEKWHTPFFFIFKTF